MPVFLSAADHKYFKPLLQLVENIREYFPDYKLIIYDNGLDWEQHETVSEGPGFSGFKPGTIGGD